MFDWLFSSPKPISIEQIVRQLENTKLERELAIREAIVERKNAYKIAETRERLKWEATAGIAAIVMSALAAFQHKNTFYAIGIIPISTFLAYESHKAYGRKQHLIFDEMERVFNDASQRLSTRLISVKEIDGRILDIINSPEALD